MSPEKIIKLQAKERFKRAGFAKPLIGLSVITIAFMITEYVSYTLYSVADMVSDENLNFILQVVAGSVTIICALLLSPIILGYIKMLSTEKPCYDIADLSYFFTDFNRYCKAVAFVFSYLLRLLIPAVLFSLPVVAVILIDKATPIPAKQYVIITLCVLSALAVLVYSTKFFASAVLFCETQNAPLNLYFKISKIVMNGKTNNAVKLTLSFFPWFLLCVTVMPLLYVLPYFTQAMCISSNWLVQLSRNEIK